MRAAIIISTMFWTAVILVGCNTYQPGDAGLVPGLCATVKCQLAKPVN